MGQASSGSHVDARGTITTVVGPGAPGAVVSDPKHLAIDTDDNVLIAHTELANLRR